VQALLAAALDEPDDERIEMLHAASEPRRQELFRRLNLAPSGTAGLVRMREDMLGHLPAHPMLKAVDRDFNHLFASWFNRGFLVLRPINWSTPAIVLEKIIRYEAVHAITDWDDLRRRLDPPDRRCFAFFHPALADDPLIFVEVALTREIPAAVAPLLAPSRPPLSPGEATTAVFYSISNCQRGLAGVSFGNFLIKQVVEDLRRALPNLTTFVTLSPVPGFAEWIDRERRDNGPLCTAEERAALAALGAADALSREALRPFSSRPAPATSPKPRRLAESRSTPSRDCISATEPDWSASTWRRTSRSADCGKLTA
jgi:malonyl-CoA decarboxylase